MDLMRNAAITPRAALEQDLGFSRKRKYLCLVGFHPEKNLNREKIEEFFRALEDLKSTNFVFTAPNGDEGTSLILERLEALEPAFGSEAVYVGSLGINLFYSCLACCDIFVGNSSAIVIESPYFGCPSILVGSRQLGRPVAQNIKTAEQYSREAISGLFAKLLEQNSSLQRSFNLDHECFYGVGEAVETIARVLDEKLVAGK